jgi:ankyrin repeat protein
VIQTLVENGADVNAQDSLGRTPLMILASRLEGIEVSNARNELLKKLKDTGKATVHGSLSMVDGLNAVQKLLELGADATRIDNSGNDAIDYCQFEYQRSNKEPNQNVLETLRKAGAKGSKATLELFDAIRKKNLDAMRAAIKSGADVNRLAPPPVPVTPLTCAAGSSPESVEFVRVLLQAGADPNRYDKNDTPLIRASRCGNLPVVKELVAAGADIHAIQLNAEFPDNAYSAAPHDKPDVADYLKSLGASKPKPVKTEPLKPGVESWNDFSELLVKSSVEKAAEALAEMIKGKVQLNVYGQSLLPGKQAFVLVRPKGMDWCNVFQIAPQRLRYEDSKKTESFARELAKVSGVSVLSIEYSDTSDAAGVFRAEPDGKSTRDDGWDRDMLEEMVGAMGDKAPAWARKQLAKTDEDEPSSTERLEMLAERERFVVAAFGVDCEPGRKVEVDFTGYAAEAFDGVAFVTS